MASMQNYITLSLKEVHKIYSMLCKNNQAEERKALRRCSSA